MESLSWNEPLIIDNSIEKKILHEYNPHIGVNLNSVHSDIRIVIQNQDQFLLPSESYIYIECKILKEDGTEYGNNKDISLINNGLMHLFERVSYKMSGQEIEGYAHVGVASTIKGLLTYSDQYNEGDLFMWKLDDKASIESSGFKHRKNLIFKTDANGFFSACIPLTHIFGFCENFTKVIYGVEHELILRRNHNNDALFKSDASVANVDSTANGKIEIMKLSWYMPHIKLSDEFKLSLYNQIENRATIPIAFLNRQCERYTLPVGTRVLDWKLNIAAGTEKPRYIVLAFQQNLMNDQKKNMGHFAHLGVQNAYIQLNQERYPEHNLNIDYAKNIYSQAINMYTDYFKNVLGNNRLPISANQYSTIYPLLVFDVSRQSERLKNSPVDIRIKANFSNAITADNTEAFAFILSDRVMALESDGSKMQVVY